MAQDFTVLDTSNAMSVQVSYINDNQDALRSCFSGTSFPTDPTPENGQLCFRTDLGVMYRYNGGWGALGTTMLDTNTTQVGNVGTGEDDLISYALAAGIMSANGDTVRFSAAGTFAANANNKTLKVYLGSTALFSTGATGFNGTDWSIEGQIIRTGASAQKAIVRFISSDSALAVSCDYTEPTEDTTGALTLKLTGEATSDDDIVCEFLQTTFGR